MALQGSLETPRLAKQHAEEKRRRATLHAAWLEMEPWIEALWD